ncbi:hypothetical protein ABH37_16640, partial [Mycobacterium haemophilum]
SWLVEDASPPQPRLVGDTLPPPPARGLKHLVASEGLPTEQQGLPTEQQLQEARQRLNHVEDVARERVLNPAEQVFQKAMAGRCLALHGSGDSSSDSSGDESGEWD